jgi:Mitochondrial carrier protein
MVTAPLDLLRIRRQLSKATTTSVSYPLSESLYASWKHIMETEGGFTALYRGNLVAIYLWMGYSAVQFTAYGYVVNELTTMTYPPLLFANKCDAGSSNDNNNDNNEMTAVRAFVAGAVAGLCATLATYPFDLCRTTFAARGIDVASTAGIVEKGGRPAAPSPPSKTPVSALPFSSLYEPNELPSLQQQGTVRERPSPTSPTPPRSLAEFARHLHRVRGWRGFYVGAAPAALQIVPYMGLNFALYHTLTTAKPTTPPSSSSPSSSSVHQSTSVSLSAYAGSVSGAVSKMIVYPMDTVKRRLQAQAFFSEHYYESTATLMNNSSGSNKNNLGMLECAVSIYKHEGVLSFYRGIVPSVLKTAISTSLTFAVFRWTKNVLEGVHDSRSRSPLATDENGHKHNNNNRIKS